ncbi:hypothetical protein [Sphingobacterium faecium]|uniref:hypothetical protein n=1 Tax=Sphingobacterium faecium TaxID=34087 RepID=UPI0024690277|nr:hypothetical protein [Sphingobacterium faecium]MDH5826420.1 hypothetical protein [Sphingobacterium faecium]
MRYDLRRLGWLLLCSLLVAGSYWVVKSYYYVLLPKLDVVFFTDWEEHHRWKLFTKICQGLLIMLSLIVADYFGCNWLKVKLQTLRLERTMRDRADSSLLSGHFLRRLYQLTSKGKTEVNVEVLDFFQYISNKLVAQHVRVALEEEWHLVKRMIALCHDRRFEIQGEEHVPQRIWSRSVPSLGLMTWVENAVEYSTEGALPICLTWSSQSDRVVLEIRNTISLSNIKRGTGNGLKLVNRLYESCKKERVQLEYTIENNTFFIVKLTFYI